MKKYAIQMRKNSWSKEWVVRSEHDTLEEAVDELHKIPTLQNIPIQADYRISEAYTVIRYKAVKI